VEENSNRGVAACYLPNTCRGGDLAEKKENTNGGMKIPDGRNNF